MKPLDEVIVMKPESCYQCACYFEDSDYWDLCRGDILEFKRIGETPTPELAQEREYDRCIFYNNG